MHCYSPLGQSQQPATSVNEPKVRPKMFQGLSFGQNIGGFRRHRHEPLLRSRLLHLQVGRAEVVVHLCEVYWLPSTRCKQCHQVRRFTCSHITCLLVEVDFLQNYLLISNNGLQNFSHTFKNWLVLKMSFQVQAFFFWGLSFNLTLLSSIDVYAIAWVASC